MNQGLLTLIDGLGTVGYYWLMEITPEQYEKTADSFPRQRRNVRYDNFPVLNAILYVLEQGCRRRGLPGSFGRVPDRIFLRLRQDRILHGRFSRQHGH